MRTRRHLLALLSSVLVLGLGAGAGAWWYHTTRADYRLQCGREALRRGERQRAEQFVTLLAAAGDRDHANLLRAEIFWQQVKPWLDTDQAAAAPLLRQAVEACNKIRDQGELRLQAVALTGRCLLYLKDPLGAERALGFVLDHQPDHADAHRGLAAIYYDQGALMRSVHHLEEVARLDPRDGRPHRQMGFIYKNLDQPAQAIDCYEEALRRELSDRVTQEVRVELAECQVKQSLYAEALRTLEGCDSQTAEAAEVLALRGDCLRGLGRTGQAVALLDGALEAYPRSPELLRLRARLAREAGATRQEADLLVRALEIDRHDYPSRYQLAQTYEGLGRHADAALQRRMAEQTKGYLTERGRLQEEALGKPWDVAVRKRLAEICRQLDQPEEAKRWLAAAAACAPAAPEVPPPDKDK
jgi:tetratricopeptide (TPR) repeat protein